MLSYTKIQWSIVALILFVNFIWIKFSSVFFAYSIKNLIIVFVVLTVLCVVYLFYKKFRPDPKIMMASSSSLLFLSYGIVMGVLSYLAYTTNEPFIDSTLAAMDSYMGFSSPDIVLMFRKHIIVYNFFIIIYDIFLIFPCIIISYFSFLEKSIYLERFLMQFIIGSLLTIFIGALLPAAGPYVWYHYSPSPTLQSALDRLYELRNNIVDISNGDGVITLPSFHTVAALLYAYTFRHEKKIIFIPILILNLLIVFSCLPIGQHYLSDILAGIIVFFVTLVIEQLIYWGVKEGYEPH